MENPKWLILTALRIEAKAVAGAFSTKFPASATQIPLASTAGPVEIHLIAMRAARLPVDAFRKDLQGVILAGLAGGLDPRLHPGDVVVEAPGGIELNKIPQTKIFQIEIPGNKVYAGKIHGSDRIIGTPTEKTDLFHQTAALAVDMESHIVRRQCELLGIPFWCIRGISDSAEQHLPVDFAKWIDDTGQIKPSALIKGIASKPSNIPELIRLGKASNLAARNMARVVFETLNAKE